MSWIYNGVKLSTLKEVEKLVGFTPYGFIYKIVTTEGREYIGQKNLKSRRTKIIGKRQLEAEGKGAFRKKRNKKTKEWRYYQTIITESNWLSYTGSSKPLEADIKNGTKYTKYILCFVKKKTLMHYEETKAILCTGALEDTKYYNDHALGRFYKKNIMNKDK